MARLLMRKTRLHLWTPLWIGGGNCIDTARLYGFTGKSEACIGRWLAANPDKREKIVISTKGGHPELETMDVSRLSKKELERDLDESLSALTIIK